MTPNPKQDPGQRFDLTHTMATLTTTTAAAAATPRSALRIFRDYVDAFNRRDRDGIRRTFHEECRTCHPDKTEFIIHNS